VKVNQIGRSRDSRMRGHGRAAPAYNCMMELTASGQTEDSKPSPHSPWPRMTQPQDQHQERIRPRATGPGGEITTSSSAIEEEVDPIDAFEEAASAINRSGKSAH